MQRIAIIISACIVLIGSGVVHGLWTDRWSEQADLADAARRLEELPDTIGGWHGTPVEVEKDAMTGLAGMVARRYVHAGSGKSVTILLACGRSGAVCTHTPDVCYAGSGYEVEKPKRFALPAQGGPAPEFWTARFVKEREAGKSHLRIFWSWYSAETWEIADHPRMRFAGEKLLFKLYLIRELAQAEEPLEGDACVEFMQELLPALSRTVLTDLKR